MEQLKDTVIRDILEKEDIVKVWSYQDLWQRRIKLFPHLDFCPSVETELENLEKFYLEQVVKKLTELEKYCSNHLGEKFKPGDLINTTPESKSTMQKYQNEHTFKDENGVSYIASWHMRFTGIPGRIFFIPEYKYRKNKILVCYIGKKLPNVTYPT